MDELEQLVKYLELNNKNLYINTLVLLTPVENKILSIILMELYMKKSNLETIFQVCQKSTNKSKKYYIEMFRNINKKFKINLEK